MNYNHYAEENQAQSKWVVGGVACATTLVVAAATFALTAGHADASLYSPAAVRATRVVPLAQAPVQTQTLVQGQNEAVTAEYAAPTMEFTPAATGSKPLLMASFSALMLSVASAMAAAFGYRSQAIAMASGGGSRSAAKGSKAAGGQAGVGYKGSTIPGSAPSTRDGKPGYVYKLGLKNGRGNVDEYSPIYNPGEWKSDGDVYEPGAAGLAIWAAGFLALLGASAFLIFSTSNL